MKKMSMFALLLAAVLVTSYSVSGTYAKYTSTYAGTDSARVAKWEFSINDTKMTSNTFTFNLFETVNDTNGSAETDVKDGGQNETIIAPGTQGSFAIKLANNSEVNAKYAIDYEITNTNNIPLEFSVDGGQNWANSLTDVAAVEDLNDANQTVLNMNGGNKTITVQWRWVYDVDTAHDTTDTQLGTAGTATITVDADITVTQID